MEQEIDFISFQNQKSAIPKHFHDTFCFSLIKKGTEKIKFNDRFIYIPQGSITIINPYEVHANPLIDQDFAVSWDTIYLSEDIVSHHIDFQHIKFTEKQIYDEELSFVFQQLHRQLHNKSLKDSDLLKTFINRLYSQNQTIEEEYQSPFTSSYLTDLINYVDEHIEEKIYLEELAQIAYQNKYGFSRKFKSLTGMAPMQYVSMQKIFSAKRAIQSGSDIVQVAMDYNFSDLAHFSRVFKKFIGISPKAYQKRFH